MSEPTADSTLDTGEATGAARAADSMQTPGTGGQEQGDQSRINGLMSLAQKRTAERDAALSEIEALKAQLAEHSMVGPDEAQPSQFDLMYGKPGAPDPDVDPMQQPEPKEVLPLVMGVHPSRPDYAPKPVNVPEMSNPSARYLTEQAEIATMKSQLRGMARANGWGSQLDN